ncbi:MAG: hypothetical protein AAGE52_13060 [Myxococcota bacterium]
MRTCSLALCVLLACGGDEGSDSDAGAERDAEIRADSARPDAGESDAGEDAAQPDAAVPDAGSDLVAAFMLTGHLSRRVLTCDGGDSFVYDISADEVAHCWDMSGGTGPECDHHPTSNNGVAYGNGMFVTTAGWGALEDDEGGLFASNGSADWIQHVPGNTYNGVAFGNGVFIANSSRPAISTDGESFTTHEGFFGGTPRGAFFSPALGGRHVLYRDTVANTWITEDNGETFFQPDDASACAFDGSVLGAAGGDVIVLYSRRDNVGCASSDGGRTWSGFAFPGEIQSHLVWTGSEFWGWGVGVRFRSSDGQTWEMDARERVADRIRHVARHEDGTLLGIVSEWGSYYEGSGAFRSTDGLTWTATAASDQLNGHPIRGMTAGWVPASRCE